MISIGMNLTLLPIFLGFYTIFYILLAMRIGYMRGSPVMQLFFKMDGEITEKKLNRNIRAHGNFSEYVPLFFILLLTLEIISNTSFAYLLAACVIFTYGRLAHAVCFAFYDYSPFLRISGMVATYIGLVMLAIQCLLYFFNNI
tara:strand:- start:67 stop:495 length:429 start_codon:yes stop_codon:yes gene_type:complete